MICCGVANSGNYIFCDRRTNTMRPGFCPDGRQRVQSRSSACLVDDYCRARDEVFLQLASLGGLTS